jgi:hypothetical protein
MFQRCLKKYGSFGLSLWSLTPLSAIFQLYRGISSFGLDKKKRFINYFAKNYCIALKI